MARAVTVIAFKVYTFTSSVYAQLHKNKDYTTRNIISVKPDLLAKTQCNGAKRCKYPCIQTQGNCTYKNIIT